MGARRALDFGATPVKNAKRIKRMETMVYKRNLGEIKRKTSYVTPTQIVNGGLYYLNLTAMVAGPNQGQRIGNEIRLRSVKVRGHETNPGLDIYLLQAKDATIPVAANFTPVKAGMLTQGASESLFNEVAYETCREPYNTRNTVDTYWVNQIRLSKRWSIPMKVRYTGPTDTEVGGNQLFLVVINRTGGNQNIEYSFTIEYTD